MRGRDKLLEPVAGGVALLAERLATSGQTGQRVFVTLPPRAQAEKRWQIARAAGAHCVEIAHPEQGLSSSLIAGINALPDGVDGALILPADMPDISADDLTKVLNAFDPARVTRGSVGDKPGHPVLFPTAWFARLQPLRGDMGARDLLKSAQTHLVPLPGSHALTDLDTPQDWQKWRG